MDEPEILSSATSVLRMFQGINGWSSQRTTNRTSRSDTYVAASGPKTCNLNSAVATTANSAWPSNAESASAISCTFQAVERDCQFWLTYDLMHEWSRRSKMLLVTFFCVCKARQICYRSRFCAQAHASYSASNAQPTRPPPTPIEQPSYQ